MTSLYDPDYLAGHEPPRVPDIYAKMAADRKRIDRAIYSQDEARDRLRGGGLFGGDE